MKIHYRDAPCGQGKTRAELIRIATSPGLYILALDRRAAIEAKVEELLVHARHAGTAPHVRVLCSHYGCDYLGTLSAAVEIASAARRGGVIASIASLPEETWMYDHLVVVVTHEGLSQADLSGFAGWHLVIDEAPSAWETSSERSPALHRHLEAAYILRPVESTGWSRVLVRDDELTLGAVRSDETLFRWGAFHRRAQSRRGVLASVTDWAEVASGRRWAWWSLWSPDELSAFHTVTVCAHAFTDSVTARLWASIWPDLEWERVITPAERAWAPRRVLIRYAAHHFAGTYFWSQPAGRACLESWCGWIASEHPLSSTTPHLFTFNEAFRHVLEAAQIGGHHPTIRVAGSNDWSHVNFVSACYAGKPSPIEAQVLAQLGVTSEEVVQAREHEDLVQFVMRSSLRDPNSTADVRVNVYDAAQAEVVAAYLRRHYPFAVAVQHHDIGISEVVKPRVGRPPVMMTEVERAEFVAKRRAAKAERQRRRRLKARAEPRKGEAPPQHDGRS